MRKYRQTYPNAKPARRPAWERTADVRQSVKMLTKALEEHDRKSGVVDTVAQAQQEGASW